MLKFCSLPVFCLSFQASLADEFWNYPNTCPGHCFANYKKIYLIVIGKFNVKKMTGLDWAIIRLFLAVFGDLFQSRVIF